jgi:hypothetical protein
MRNESITGKVKGDAKTPPTKVPPIRMTGADGTEFESKKGTRNETSIDP